MFTAISALISLFRIGQEVANPVAWKTGQITANVIGGFILGVVNFPELVGHPLPFTIDAATANQIGGVALTLGNAALTMITSKKVGILPAKNETVYGA